MGILYSTCTKERIENKCTDTTCHHCNTTFIDPGELNKDECSISNYLIRDMIHFFFY